MENKVFWKSKTFWLGVAIAIGGIAEFLTGVPEGAAISTVVAGVLSVIVRFLTTQSITIK